MWTPKWTPKIGVFVKKINFWPHKTIKYAKKSGKYAFILHNYPILVRSTGIEDARHLPKAFIFKAFLRWTPKWTPKILFIRLKNILKKSKKWLQPLDKKFIIWYTLYINSVNNKNAFGIIQFWYPLKNDGRVFCLHFII